MRKLDFTEEHERELFEMLKELFPSDYPYPRQGTNGCIFNKGFHGTEKVIHWLELSWTVLNQMVSVYEESPIKTGEQIRAYGQVCFNQMFFIHPIDWLYGQWEEYKGIEGDDKPLFT